MIDFNEIVDVIQTLFQEFIQVVPYLPLVPIYCLSLVICYVVFSFGAITGIDTFSIVETIAGFFAGIMEILGNIMGLPM